ncbi:hypothetical protein KEM56_006253 [Ascosphaera pollenicola]|nr:hypothetical protein KEM56_006253 [Ascosphaera pollenicola]
MSVDTTDQYEAFPSAPTEKPWLNPQRRKLRHLQGLSLRNLVVSRRVEVDGPRRTFDDDNAPNALQTVAKEQARLKVEGLHVSRSVGNLSKLRHSPSPLSSDVQKGKKSSQNDQGSLPTRQRRGTLPWAGVSPQVRQSYLEDVAEDQLADTFFSLHCSTIDEPVYISEVMEHAMNPDFRFFDLSTCGPLVSRLDELTVKVWAKSGAMVDYVLLLEQTNNLRSLHYLGKSLDTFHHSLPTNSVIYHFSEGVYATLPRVPTWTSPPPLPDKKLEGVAQSTSSYDALMRLANLDDCIQDALITREKLEAQMNAIIEQNRSSVDLVIEKSHAQERLADVRRAAMATRKQIRASTKRKAEISRSLEARRNAIAKGRKTQQEIEETLAESKPAVASSRAQLKQVAEEITDQIRRVCEDVSHIYPIDAIQGKPLSFTICGIYLPDSIYEESNREQIAAALGYAAHLLYLVSFYTSTPLPYPIKACLSKSTIDDPLSMRLVDRTFPLYSTSPYYRFEYGVFLFNKNIEYLMTRLGLRIIDIRQTLPNMKYLLYILTAGTRELPSRKAGGVIRGLLGSGRTDTPFDSSRRNSQDSAFSAGGISIGNEALSRKMREQLIRENALVASPAREPSSQQPEDDKDGQSVPPSGARTIGPRVVLSDEHSNDRFLT